MSGLHFFLPLQLSALLPQLDLQIASHNFNMANILSILIATLAVVSPVVQAGGCTPGLTYCGHTLMTYGYSGAESLNYKTLYRCQSSGIVQKLEKCSWSTRCVDGGGGKDDFCLFVP
ncbi:hypothetical protein E4U09_007342 [Claviceps aff. purpurea]|uniref:Uncharacterized protein n=1 Tax=Claviceps aff. purpurea TaxID=1967640 RepID=A0A9P7TY69_9HYPO|nr:hypothetical protein E4U09_007342 [Claviceps aff. purpurea]